MVDDYEAAQNDFFESFRNFDEAGSLQRIQVLKYFVLANMLMESQIDPFSSQETKPYTPSCQSLLTIRYKNDPQIQAMTNLVTAYQQKDIPLFSKILQRDAKDILSDPFIRTYIDTILRSIRNQVIVAVVRPYKRIELSFLAQKVGVTDEEVEELLALLILDRKLGRNGKIDRVKKLLVFDDVLGEENEIDRFDVMDKWAKSVDDIWGKVVNSAAIVDWGT